MNADLMNQPVGRTRLVPGSYTLIITGPTGLVMKLEMDMAVRTRFEALIDDELLQELLVITSVAGGLVEAEMHRVQRAERKYGIAATNTEPAKAGTTNVGGRAA